VVVGGRCGALLGSLTCDPLKRQAQYIVYERNQIVFGAPHVRAGCAGTPDKFIVVVFCGGVCSTKVTKAHSFRVRKGTQLSKELHAAPHFRGRQQPTPTQDHQQGACGHRVPSDKQLLLTTLISVPRRVRPPPTSLHCLGAERGLHSLLRVGGALRPTDRPTVVFWHHFPQSRATHKTLVSC
jgi:hypothetical protein